MRRKTCRFAPAMPAGIDPSVLSEYEAVRQHAGLLDLSRRGKIRVTGTDRIAFLHNILSQDIRSLTVGQGAYAALLTGTGRVQADLFVFIFPDFVLLDAEKGLEAKIMECLDKLLITEDVQLESASSVWAHLSLQGPEAAARLKDLAFDPGPWQPLTHQTLNFESVPLYLIHRTHTGETGFDVLVPSEKSAALKAVLKNKDSSLLEIGEAAHEILRIEAGILRYGQDITEEMILPETGLEEIAASETKGCYPGQEVVAKVKTYGRRNRKITGLIFEPEARPEAGMAVQSEGKAVGTITSAAFSPALQRPVALALLQAGFFEAGKKLISAAGSAVTTDLPF